jgi:hypothetical protein
MKDCKRAVLIYPTQLTRPLDEYVGTIRVQSLTFGLDGDLDEAGRAFLSQLNIGADPNSSTSVVDTSEAMGDWQDA